MNYIFKTTATMKEYNNKKWYIDGGIVSDMRINADSVYLILLLLLLPVQILIEILKLNK